MPWVPKAETENQNQAAKKATSISEEKGEGGKCIERGGKTKEQMTPRFKVGIRGLIERRAVGSALVSVCHPRG
eukprot:scaffold153356_cov17-Prasinocladus_malaysianus.AAC.1